MKAILLAVIGMAFTTQLQAQNTVAPSKTADTESPARQAARKHPQHHPLSEAQKAQLKDQEEGPQSKSPGNSRAKRPRSFAPTSKREVPKQAAADHQ